PFQRTPIASNKLNKDEPVKPIDHTTNQSKTAQLDRDPNGNPPDIATPRYARPCLLCMEPPQKDPTQQRSTIPISPVS
ncbi:hypothetical protein NPIL_588131, partial [Nephila pilipes]